MYLEKKKYFQIKTLWNLYKYKLLNIQTLIFSSWSF